MKKILAIADALAFPLDAITSTLVVYGGKGMGKTNFASVLVEEIDANGLRFAFLDPVGVSWGLRHSVDGKGRGIEILILGGIHGDIPIEPTGGAVVADLVVDESVNVLIDISRHPDGSMWSIGERIRFVTDYCKRLYQRQGEKRRPIMQVIDEAARFAPQTVRKGDEQVAASMGAIAVLVEEGRNVGIGVTLLTLRSARLNKDVAELADCMIAFRTVGPNSRGAVLDWLGENVEKERLRELDTTVRKLPVGSALVVSPGWLNFEGVVPFRARRTFDSSKTPKPGEQVHASGPGAKPDLNKYQQRMAETIERAAENDPKELKKRIVQLERDLKKAHAASTSAPDPATMQRTIVAAVESATDAMRREIAARDAKIAKQAGAMRDALETILSLTGIDLAGVVRDVIRRTPMVKAAPKVAERPWGRLVAAAKTAGAPRDASTGIDLPKGERAVLTAAAQNPSGASREQITVLTGYKRSTRDLYLQTLGRKGLITTSNGDVVATAAGVAALGEDFEPLPTCAGLREYWLSRLPAGERAVFEVVVSAYPGAVDRDAISEHTLYKRSTRDLYIQVLTRRKLVVVADRGSVRASADLFE